VVQEYAYEHKLFTDPTSRVQFEKLNANIRKICSQALEARGVDLQKKASCQRLCPEETELEPWRRALSLGQLRNLNVLMEAMCRERHTPHEELTLRDMEDLRSELLDGNYSYAHCFLERPQCPEFYVVASARTRFYKLLEAIEWHAEARQLSDMAKYHIYGLTVMDEYQDFSSGDETIISSLEQDEEVMINTQTGVLLYLDDITASYFEENQPSMYMLHELYLGEKHHKIWDLACCTGVIATVRPFPSGYWEHGHFQPDLCWKLARLNVGLQDLLAADEKAKVIADHIEKIPGSLDILLTIFNSRLPARVLGPVLRHCAYMDSKEESSRAMYEYL
jgi:hypothetical protein